MTNPFINKIKTTYKYVKQKKVTLHSGIVGTRLTPYIFKVDTRQISNYAAAIGDENSCYYISEKSAVQFAHPVFPVRISWEIIKDLSRWLETDLPVDLSTPLVHQAEYLDIQRLPKPGDTLTVTGQIVALEPHRRGARLVLKFDYHEEQDRPVLTEFITAILFNAICADKGKSISMPAAITRVDENDVVWEETFKVSRIAPYIYDGCTDMIYPVHTDQLFARQMGLPDIILQGSATLAMSVSTILAKELDDNPKAIRILTGKFTDIVIPPNRLTVRLLKRAGKQLFFDVKDQKGRYAIRGGYLEIKKTGD